MSDLMNEVSSTVAALSSSSSSSVSPIEKPRKPRGFAAMDPKLVSELATRGGKAAHRAGTAHEFTSEEARIAGRKGALATHAKRRAKAAEGTSVEATAAIPANIL